MTDARKTHRVVGPDGVVAYGIRLLVAPRSRRAARVRGSVAHRGDGGNLGGVWEKAKGVARQLQRPESPLNCPQCLENGVEFPGHPLSIDMSIKTASHVLPNGAEHAYDPEMTTTRYRCAIGHLWTHTERKPCWCGWETP